MIIQVCAFKLFEFYKNEIASQDIIMPDFKLEYGRRDNSFIQIDEPPTHDSARFWARKYFKVGEQQEGHALDKEFLREYLRKVGFTGEGKPPLLPHPVVEEVSKRCIGAYDVITGKSRIEDLNLKTINRLIEGLEENF